MYLYSFFFLFSDLTISDDLSLSSLILSSARKFKFAIDFFILVILLFNPKIYSWLFIFFLNNLCLLILLFDDELSSYLSLLL